MLYRMQSTNKKCTKVDVNHCKKHGEGGCLCPTLWMAIAHRQPTPSFSKIKYSVIIICNVIQNLYKNAYFAPIIPPTHPYYTPF